MNICEECESPIADKTLCITIWNMTSEGLDSETLEFCSQDCIDDWKYRRYHNHIEINISN